MGIKFHLMEMILVQRETRREKAASLCRLVAYHFRNMKSKCKWEGKESEMKKAMRIVLYGMAGCILLAGAFRYRSHRLQEGMAERILRFHVIANSDTKADQELKLKVRDEIGEYLSGELDGAKGLAECEQAVTERLSEIEQCAKEVITEEGYTYAVKATVGDSDFPEKTYGSYTFPGGTYRALKVTIGEGAGQNWWCVMYPNLCFANSVYEVIDEDSDEKLQAVLTQDEYAEIMAEGKIRIGFKYLKFFH